MRRDSTNDTTLQSIIIADCAGMKKPTAGILASIKLHAYNKIGHGISLEYFNKRFVNPSTAWTVKDLVRLYADAYGSLGSFGDYAKHHRRARKADED